MTYLPSITIAGRRIAADEPPFIIAEMSANHNGDLGTAYRIMAAAKEAGADALKLQTYTPDTITIDHAAAEFKIEDGLWAGRTLHQLYRQAHTPWEWHPKLFEHGRKLDLVVFSSPFDFTAVDFLESCDVPAYKIASFELIDLPLIRKCAATGKPLIMSTGMASQKEINEAVQAARNAGATEIALLHCTSGYPTPIEESNLRTIPHLMETFHVVVGLSDHTLGTSTSVAAVALGASIIEKHLKLSQADVGPDAAFSLTPGKFSSLCVQARLAWKALGQVRTERSQSEIANVALRRSLYIVADVKKGEQLTPDTLRSIRPGNGLAPKHYESLIGKRVNRDIIRGTPMSWDFVD